VQTRGKIGRRAFAKTLATTAGAALASTEAAAQTPSADTDLRAARQDRIQAAREIAQVALPRSVEPAFRFKA
jgi:hypothetical protein